MPEPQEVKITEIPHVEITGVGLPPFGSIVKVTVGQVFNIGNYQSARVETGIETTVHDGETKAQAFERAYLEAKNAFAKCAKNFVPQQKG